MNTIQEYIENLFPVTDQIEEMTYYHVGWFDFGTEPMKVEILFDDKENLVFAEISHVDAEPFDFECNRSRLRDLVKERLCKELDLPEIHFDSTMVFLGNEGISWGIRLRELELRTGIEHERMRVAA